jgi:LAS superfamily LD-carboxypeptidase LdcB
MRGFFLLLLFLLAACAAPSAFPEDAFFAILKGPVYSCVGLSSPRIDDLLLSFGDRMKIEDQSTHGSIPWYLCSIDALRFYLPGAYVVLVPAGITYDAQGNISIGSERVDKWHALPLDYMPNDLVPVPPELKAPGYEERELLLRREAADVFARIIQDARMDGVNISIISAFRDARYQAALYSSAIRRLGLFQGGVAKPGHSEHQLGTTCDLTTDEIGGKLSTDFEKTAAYRWLEEHMHRYGVFLTYPRFRGKAEGYMYEPWHFRYWGERRWDRMRDAYGLFLSR